MYIISMLCTTSIYLHISYSIYFSTYICLFQFSSTSFSFTSVSLSLLIFFHFVLFHFVLFHFVLFHFVLFHFVLFHFQFLKAFPSSWLFLTLRPLWLSPGLAVSAQCLLGNMVTFCNISLDWRIFSSCSVEIRSSLEFSLRGGPWM